MKETFFGMVFEIFNRGPVYRRKPMVGGVESLKGKYPMRGRP